jgi:hypothetical protein
MKRNDTPNLTRLTVGAPWWRLVDTLRRSGWGILRPHRGQLRTVLVELTKLANHAGVVTTTREQLAELASVHPRTVQRIMPQLVALGMVDYEPGYWSGHRGHPSRIVVSRRALWAAINPARWAQHTRRRAQEIAQAARTAGLRFARRHRIIVVPLRQDRETVCLPSSPTEELGAAPPPPTPPPRGLSPAAQDTIRALRAQLPKTSTSRPRRPAVSL